jgi:hypothetical protein
MISGQVAHEGFLWVEAIKDAGAASGLGDVIG